MRVSLLFASLFLGGLNITLLGTNCMHCVAQTQDEEDEWLKRKQGKGESFAEENDGRRMLTAV